MYAEERQRTIVNLAMRFDRVAVTKLAERFDVTTETIRRDLDVLDRRGILRRVHGGAVPAENVRLVETPVASLVGPVETPVARATKPTRRNRLATPLAREKTPRGR